MRQVLDIRVAQNGRMVLPRSVRDALGVSGSGVVVLSLDGDEVRLASLRQSIKQAQALYRAHVKNDQSADDFLEARRIETEQDSPSDTKL